MIRLPAIPKPTELTSDVAQEMTALYKKEGTAVWQKTYIKKALLEMSSNKCCYCECRLTSVSHYLEIEHFHPKSHYPDEVIVWNNLLPSCKRCNVNKGNHDTKKEPIVHPVKDHPKSHFILRAYRFYNKTDLGQMTIEVIGLNNRERLVKKRFEIGVELIEQLENLWALCTEYDKEMSSSTRRRNRIIETLRNLMREGTRQYEFSATAATVILHEESYAKIKFLFIKHQLWDDELIDLETEVKFCAFNVSSL
jgi:uncharacterized protein (TIGR02646 family)